MIDYTAIFIGLRGRLENLSMVIEDKKYRYFYKDALDKWQKISKNITDQRILDLMKSGMEWKKLK